jgi:hypothetical protein
MVILRVLIFAFAVVQLLPSLIVNIIAPWLDDRDPIGVVAAAVSAGSHIAFADTSVTSAWRLVLMGAHLATSSCGWCFSTYHFCHLSNTCLAHASMLAHV